MEINHKSLAVFLALVLVTASFATLVTGFDEQRETEIVLVSLEGENDENRIESIGGEVLEEYPDSALVEIPTENRFDLERKAHDFQSLENRDYVGLQSHSFNTGEGTPEVSDDLEIDEYPSGERGYYILQFIGPISSEWQEELEDQGVVLHEYRHRFNSIVEMDYLTRRRVEDLDFVN